MQNLDPTYLRYIYDNLIKGSVHRENSSELPEGLIGLYEEAFEEHLPVLQRQQLLQRFALFALLKKEVSAAFVAEVLGRNEQEISEFILNYTSWFNSPNSKKYQLYHERLKVYIIQKLSEREILDLNDKLIARLEQAIEEQNADEFEIYALESLSSHLFVKAMIDGDRVKIKQFTYDSTIWERQIKASKSFEWCKKMLDEMMQCASKFDEEEVIECAINKVDLYQLEQNDAPRILELIKEGDIEKVLQRIEAFGGNDKEGLQRKFILYMLCLMELTLFDSKKKAYTKDYIQKILKHFDENIPAFQPDLINWNDFFPIEIVFQISKECINYDYLVLFNRTKLIKSVDFIIKNEVFYKIYKQTFFLNHQVSIDHLNRLIDIAEIVFEINTLDGFDLIKGTENNIGKLSKSFKSEHNYELNLLQNRIIFLLAINGSIDDSIQKAKINNIDGNLEYFSLNRIKESIPHIIKQKKNIDFLFDLINSAVFNSYEWEKLLNISFIIDNLGYQKLFEDLYSQVIKKFKGSHFAGSPPKEYSNANEYVIRILIENSKIEDAVELTNYLDIREKNHANRSLYNHFYFSKKIEQSKFYFDKLDQETQSFILEERFKAKIESENEDEKTLKSIISEIPNNRQKLECLIKLGEHSKNIDFIEEAEKIVLNNETNLKVLGFSLEESYDYLLSKLCKAYILFEKYESISMLCSKMNETLHIPEVSQLIAKKGLYKLAIDIANLILKKTEKKCHDYNNFCKTLIYISKLTLLNKQKNLTKDLINEVKLKSSYITDSRNQYEVRTQINQLKFQLEGEGILKMKTSKNSYSDFKNKYEQNIHSIFSSQKSRINLNDNGLINKVNEADIINNLIISLKYQIPLPIEKNINGIVEKLLQDKFINNTKDITEDDNEIVSKIEDFLKDNKLNSAVFLSNSIVNEEIRIKSFDLFNDFIYKIDDSELCKSTILEAISLIDKDNHKQVLIIALTGSLFKYDFFDISEILKLSGSISYEEYIVDNCYIEIGVKIAEWCCFEDAKKIIDRCYLGINRALGFAKISETARENGFMDEYAEFITEAFEEADYIFEAETDDYQMYEWKAKAFLRIFTFLSDKRDYDVAIQAFEKALKWIMKIEASKYYNENLLLVEAYALFLTSMNEFYISKIFDSELVGLKENLYSIGQKVVENIGFEKSIKILNIISDESNKEIFKKGIYDSLEITEDKKIYIGAFKEKNIGGETNLSLVVKYALKQILSEENPQEKLDCFNRTLNLQWAIDLKKELDQIPN